MAKTGSREWEQQLLDREAAMYERLKVKKPPAPVAKLPQPADPPKVEQTKAPPTPIASGADDYWGDDDAF